MSTIADFYPGETKRFSVLITLNGAAPDISGDTVTLTLRSGRPGGGGAVALTKLADVATSGAIGVALITLEPADTAALNAGVYCWDIVWRTAGGEHYVLRDGTLNLRVRVSEPT